MLNAAEQLNKPAAAPKHPLWVRSVIFVWIVLFGALSCAQAAHTHTFIAGQGKAQAGTQLAKALDATQPGGEESCPLCIAMHIAVPAPALPLLHITSTTTFVAVTPFLTWAPQSLWHFHLFGRPPPALLNS